MKKRIFFVNRTLSLGGIEKNTLRLSEFLINEGYEVHIILLSNIIKYNISNKIKIHILNDFLNSPISLIVRAFNKFIPIVPLLLSGHYYKNKFLKELNNIEKQVGKSDLIVLNGLGAYSCLYQIYDDRVIISSRSTKSSIIKYKVPYGFKFLAKMVLQKMLFNKNIVTVSNGIKRDLINKINIKPKSIDVIYNPLDFIEIKKLANERISYKEKYIVHVGRFSVEKRHDILIDAFSQIEDKNIKLVLVGDGNSSNINRLIKKLNLLDRVILIGFDSNPFRWMKNAELLVLSSEFEGLPTVLIESLICNTTVVSTFACDAVKEILPSKLHNYIANVNDVRSLVEKINFSLENPMQENDYIEHIEKFNYKNIIEQYIKIIES